MTSFALACPPVWDATEVTSFETGAAVLGGLLVLGSLLSGLARRSFLSLAALFVAAGFVLGQGAIGVLAFRPSSGWVTDLATVALIVILFRDGLEADAEMIQSHWQLPLRKLVIAMPITAAIVAVLCHVLVGLDWTESGLLGALLSPTDPVLSSGVVTDPRIPRVIRHSLNLESGLNDGLALPAVLAFAAALDAHTGHFVWWRFLLQDVGFGFAFGIACGLLGSLWMPRGQLSDAGETIPDHQRALYGLGLAFATYGLTVLPPHGNGFIGVFVAAVVIGVRRPDLREHFAARTEELVEVVKLGIFAVFGSLLDDPRPVRRWMARGRGGDRDLSAGPPGRDLDRARGHPHRPRQQGVHGLVRTQGGGHDGFLSADSLASDRSGRAHLQHRRAGRVRLDLRPRAERHAGHRLDGPAQPRG